MSTMEPASLIHPAYRHLDRRVRLAGLTLAQWSQLVASAATAYALAKVLPFGDTYNVSVAVTLAGVPVAALIAAGTGAVHPLDVLLAIARWRRTAGLYLPGVADDDAPAGYRLRHPDSDPSPEP